MAEVIKWLGLQQPQHEKQKCPPRGRARARAGAAALLSCLPPAQILCVYMCVCALTFLRYFYRRIMVFIWRFPIHTHTCTHMILYAAVVRVA